MRKLIGHASILNELVEFHSKKILPNKIRRPDGFLFWFHAASIGELNSILPIINFFLKLVLNKLHHMI